MAFVHTCGKGPVFLTPFGHDAEALRAPGTTKLFAAIRSGTPINHGDYMARSTLIATMGQLSSYAGHNRSLLRFATDRPFALAFLSHPWRDWRLIISDWGKIFRLIGRPLSGSPKYATRRGKGGLPACCS
jgi:hypothetical protein